MRKKQKNRIRKSTKYSCTIIAIILFIISFSGLTKNLSEENMKTRTKEIYNYTNKFNYDYKVNLIENKYIKEEQLTDKSLAYVTDLIDTITLDLNYDYIADKQSNIKYTYSVIGRMQAVYTKNGEEQKILDESEVLVEEKQSEINSDKINISEKLELDLKEKNKLLAQFQQQMGMSIDAKYTITLNINTLTNIEDNDVNNDYSSSIQIDLAEKTSKITGENNKEDSEYIAKDYQVNSARNVIVIIFDIILLAISVALISYVTKSRTAVTVKNEYRQELNRILKLCQDKIVKVSTRPSENDTSVVYVKDFGEIVKLAEELFKPILYYFDNQKEEAWFSVMSGSSTYRYILRR